MKCQYVYSIISHHNLNLMGTWWDHIGNFKNPNTIHPPTGKNKLDLLLSYLLPSVIGCQEFMFLIVFVTHFWVWGGWRDFIFFLVIPNVFPSNSQGIPIKFSKCSPNPQCVPQDVPNSTTFLSHMFSPKLNFHIFQTTINPLYNHALGDHFFFFL